MDFNIKLFIQFIINKAFVSVGKQKQKTTKIRKITRLPLKIALMYY